jgi:hypothetical protein
MTAGSIYSTSHHRGLALSDEHERAMPVSALAIALIAAGIRSHPLATRVLQRFWRDLVGGDQTDKSSALI